MGLAGVVVEDGTEAFLVFHSVLASNGRQSSRSRHLRPLESAWLPLGFILSVLHAILTGTECEFE